MKIKKQITLHDSENLGRYFNEIKGYESLDKVQEHELIRRYQADGDTKAFDLVIKANLKFVVSVAKKYQGQGAPLSDLISEANIGLIDAVKNFDLAQNVKLFSYAIWRMDMYIRKRLEVNKRIVQLPVNREVLMNKVKVAVMKLEHTLTRHPTSEELCLYLKINERLDVSEADVGDALVHALRVKSLQDPVATGDDDDVTLEDQTAGDMNIDQTDELASRTLDLDRYLSHLSQQEYDVLVLSLGLNSEPTLRPQDIAKALYLKQKDIANIKNRALKRLRKLHRIDALKDHL